MKVPVGFLERDDLPSLLGRLSCLEEFRLVLDKKITVFDRN